MQLVSLRLRRPELQERVRGVSGDANQMDVFRDLTRKAVTVGARLARSLFRDQGKAGNSKPSGNNNEQSRPTELLRML